MKPIPFARQSYKLRSLPASAQRCINLYAETLPPDAKSPLILRSVSGLRPFATLPGGAVRGVWNMSEVLYAVAGTTLYRVTSGGSATVLGTVAGAGPVYLSDNGTQLVVVAAPNAYVWNGSVFAQVSDVDFPGAGSVAYLDGYHIFNKPGTGQWFISNLLNASSYSALDFASAESSPDPLVRVLVDHRELWLFGSRSTEVWVNTGAATFPFERQPGSILERGCAAAGSVAKLDNTVYWLADDGIVYRAQGYAPARVSTHAIEEMIADAGDVSAARSLAWTQDGHAFYCLTVPGKLSVVYDAATGLWHERVSAGRADWRGVGVALAYGKLIVGDDSAGVLYSLDPTYYQEGAAALVRTPYSPPLTAGGARAFMSRLQIDMETGIGTDTLDPAVALSWSDDGGRTWSADRVAGAGKLGEYRRRVIWNRLGSFRDRVYRFSVSDAVPVTVIGAMADIEGGT